MWGMCWSTWRPAILDSLGAGVTGACKLLSMGAGTLTQSVNCRLEPPLRLSGCTVGHQNSSVAFSVLLRSWKNWELVFEKSRRWWWTFKREQKIRGKIKPKTHKKRKDTVEGECGKCSGKESRLCKAVAMRWRCKHGRPHLLSFWSYCWPRQEAAVIKGRSHRVLFIIIAVIIKWQSQRVSIDGINLEKDGNEKWRRNRGQQ